MTASSPPVRAGSILHRTAPERDHRWLPDQPIGSLQDRPDQSPTGEVPEPEESSRAMLDSQRPPRITPETPQITSIRTRVDDWLEGESVDSLDAAKASTLVEDSLDDAASVSSAAVASAASFASTAGIDDEAAPLMHELQLGFVQLRDSAMADGWSPRQLGMSQSTQLKQVVLTLQTAQPDHWVLLVRRLVQHLQRGGLLQPEVSESLQPWLERQWEHKNAAAARAAAVGAPFRVNGASRAAPLERAAPEASELDLGADLGLDDLSSMSTMLEQMESEQRRFEAMVAAGSRNGSESRVGDETRVELAELAELTSGLAELQSDLMRSTASSYQPAPVPVSAASNVLPEPGAVLSTVLGGFRSVSGTLGSLLLDELPVEETQRAVELATPVAATTDRPRRFDEPPEQLGTWYALGSDSGDDDDEVVVDVSGQGVSLDDDFFDEHRRATELVVSQNALRALPARVAQLRQLRTLTASEAKLGALPPELCRLSSLTSLDVSSNELKALPDQLGGLLSLRSLQAYKNMLAALPESIGDLGSLRELNMFNNKVLKLPASMGKLRRLTEVNLAANKLMQITEASVQGWRRLEVLTLYDNRLVRLPPLGHMGRLKQLYLNSNNLQEMPNLGIEGLPSLTALELHKNRITAIPSGYFRGLVALQRLVMGRNSLKVIGGGIDSCRHLQSLQMEENELEELPAELGRCPGLQVLFVQSNRLPTLPASLSQLTSLERLNLQANPLGSDSAAVVGAMHRQCMSHPGGTFRGVDGQLFKAAAAKGSSSATSPAPLRQPALEPPPQAPPVEPATAQPSYSPPPPAATTSSSPRKYVPPSPASPSLDEQLTALHPGLNSMCDEAEQSVSPKIARAANAAAERVVHGGLAEHDDTARVGASVRPATATPAARPASAAVTPKASAKNIEIAFRRIDKSGDGSLSRAELVEACRQDAAVRALLGLPPIIRQEDGSRDQFERVFQQLDADASQSVSLDEFVRFFSGGGGGDGSTNSSGGGSSSSISGSVVGSRCKSGPSAEPSRMADAAVPAAAAAAGSDAERHEARIAELEKQIREMRDNPASFGCEVIGAPWRPLCQPSSPSLPSSPSGATPPQQRQFVYLQQLQQQQPPPPPPPPQPPPPQQQQQAGKGMKGPGGGYGYVGKGQGRGPSPMAMFGSRPPPGMASPGSGKGSPPMMRRMSGGPMGMGSPPPPGKRMPPMMAPPVPLGPGMGPGGPSGKGMAPGSPSGPRPMLTMHNVAMPGMRPSTPPR